MDNNVGCEKDNGTEKEHNYSATQEFVSLGSVLARPQTELEVVVGAVVASLVGGLTRPLALWCWVSPSVRDRMPLAGVALGDLE